MATYLQIPHHAQYEGKAMSRMSHFQKENIMTDFKITINGKAIHCHKLVLAAACPYFRALFNSGMKESLSGEVAMNALKYDSFYEVVQYMYGRDIDVSLKSMSDLFEICEILLFDSLKEQLCLVAKGNINADNCIQFWKMADTYNLAEITSMANSIMEEEFSVVARSNDFKTLTLSELLDYIHTANMSNRDHALSGCFDWVNVDKERRKSLVHILGHVQLDKCSVACLQEFYIKNKDIVSLEVAHMFVDALSRIGRSSEPKLVLLGGLVEGTLNKRCWFKSDFSPWEMFLEIPDGYQALHSHVVCLPRGFAILCGGDDLQKNTMYDGNSKSWNDLPSTPEGLTYTTAIVKGNEILLLGGQINKIAQNSVYSLDMSTMKWTDSDYPRMLDKQVYPIATTVNDDIFVLFNHENGPHHTPAPMQKYDSVNKNWNYLRSFPNGCVTVGVKLVTYNIRSLYCIGGMWRLCARYDIDTNAWTLLTSSERKYFYQTPVLMNSKIYIGGGRLYGKVCADMEEYDIENDIWKVSSSRILPESLYRFAMDMVDWL